MTSVLPDIRPLEEPNRQTIVLLHGFGAHPLIMRPLASFLADNGFATVNWGYPSTRRSIPHNAAALSGTLRRLSESSQPTSIHLVTHSMGGIVARCALDLDPPPRLGRMVMLAPPNGGSHIARLAGRVYGRICPVLRQLSDHPESLVNRMARNPRLEIGIIAAAGDRVVALANTHLPTQADHIVLDGSHLSLPLRRHSAEKTLAFLRTGRFAPPQPDRQDDGAKRAA